MKVALVLLWMALLLSRVNTAECRKYSPSQKARRIQQRQTTIVNKQASRQIRTVRSARHEPTQTTRGGAQDPSSHWLFQKIDGIVFVSYFCNVMALGLPVLLVPMAVSENLSNTKEIASRVASISSVATLGGALGKFTNGFICQALGSYHSSKIYFVGLALCSVLFSLAQTPQSMGLAYAGMEYFASIQFASLNVMLANYYERSPKQLATALTILGLSSTSGAIAAKVVGTTLTSALDWRLVARIGGTMALLGSLWISRAPKPNKEPEYGISLQSVIGSLRATLGTSLFCLLALAHGMAFVTRGTERILGTFYQHMVPELSQSLSGGLTMSVTLGLIYGLVTGSKQINKLPDKSAKKRFLARRYATSIVATLCLVVFSSPFAAPYLPGNGSVRTAMIALLSGYMVSNVAYQYYQFPAMIAKTLFSDHKAVAISFLDGFGFLLSTPIFAMSSKIVPRYGWPITWAMFAGLFTIGGLLMMQNVDKVLQDS